MATAVLFATTASLYTLATACFFAFVTRRGEPFRRFAVGSLRAAAVAHTLFLGAGLWLDETRGANVWTALAVVSLLPALGHLFWSRRGRFDVLGVFVTPVSLLLFLGASLGTPGTTVSHGLRSAVLPVHVTANLVGIVLFSLATSAGVGFLIQDRLLRRKQLQGLFRRLPSLDELDRAGFRTLTWGFALYTLGIVTGMVFMVGGDRGGIVLDASRIAAFVAWALFAAVVFARLAIGWRGRRAALVTIAGFLLTIVTLFAYVFRGDAG